MMMLISDQNRRLSLQQFSQVVCQAMVPMNSLQLQRNFLNTKIQIIYKTNIRLTRIRSTASVLTQFRGNLSHLTADITLCANEGMVEEQLKSLLDRPSCQISSLLLLNQLSLRHQEGKFMLSRERGFLYRIEMSNLRFLTDSRKLKIYLTQKVVKSYSIFSRELQRLLTYLNPKLSTATSKNLTQQEQKIMVLREVLEKNRQFRPKSTKMNLSGCGEMTACEALDLAFNRFKIKKITSAQLLQSRQLYQDKAKQIKKTFKNHSSVILQGMRILSICKQQKTICEGGFARISRGIFDIEIYPSVNGETMAVVGQRGYCTLVCKQQKKSQYYHALLNQQMFLIFARNQRCPHIGRYYSDKRFARSFENGIYLEHYPSTLAQKTDLNYQKLLQNMTQIAQALSFLNDIGVAHRDLKLHNIMIDRNSQVKLIDFGSAAPIIWAQKCRSSSFTGNADNRLASTQGYYLPYKQAAIKCVSLGSKFTKEEYECHQNFDVYSLGIILQKKMLLNLPVVGDFLREQLLYMSRKCLQPNPDDRLTPIQAAVWLNYLQDYAWQRHSVWNYAQRKAREAQQNQSSLEMKEEKIES